MNLAIVAGTRAKVNIAFVGTSLISDVLDYLVPAVAEAAARVVVHLCVLAPTCWLGIVSGPVWRHFLANVDRTMQLLLVLWLKSTRGILHVVNH